MSLNINNILEGLISTLLAALIVWCCNKGIPLIGKWFSKAIKNQTMLELLVGGTSLLIIGTVLMVVGEQAIISNYIMFVILNISFVTSYYHWLKRNKQRYLRYRFYKLK
ncbi:MAG: hypothetical protein K0Q79_587 [Flavipsychrobacter sp.]|jgi:CDP-diglyceride synthetase|nr:hypothetical protein [Flavipsychrobacter sp.]